MFSSSSSLTCLVFRDVPRRVVSLLVGDLVRHMLSCSLLEHSASLVGLVLVLGADLRIRHCREGRTYDLLVGVAHLVGVNWVAAGLADLLLDGVEA